MEITNDIKAKVFAQYIGQDVAIPKNYKFSGYRTDAPLAELIGVYDQSIKLQDINCFYPVQDFKLILKPISAITDEDKEYCYHRHSENCSYDYTQDYNGIKSAADHCFKKNPKHLFYLSNQYQYLISKGYDLPHYLLGGKTLHEAGLAIYE